jgi:hypothetical protein
MQQLEQPYHHPGMAQMQGALQEMVEEAMVPQDEGWDCPPQTPRTRHPQMKTQEGGFQNRETEGNKGIQKGGMMPRQTNSSKPCMIG